MTEAYTCSAFQRRKLPFALQLILSLAEPHCTGLFPKKDPRGSLKSKRGSQPHKANKTDGVICSKPPTRTQSQTISILSPRKLAEMPEIHSTQPQFNQSSSPRCLPKRKSGIACFDALFPNTARLRLLGCRPQHPPCRSSVVHCFSRFQVSGSHSWRATLRRRWGKQCMVRQRVFVPWLSSP